MEPTGREDGSRSPQKVILALSQASNNGDGSNLTPRAEQEGESLLPVRPGARFL